MLYIYIYIYIHTYICHLAEHLERVVREHGGGPHAEVLQVLWVITNNGNKHDNATNTNNNNNSNNDSKHNNNANTNNNNTNNDDTNNHNVEFLHLPSLHILIDFGLTLRTSHTQALVN